MALTAESSRRYYVNDGFAMDRSNLDPSHQAAIINCMVDTSIEIYQGQQLDMDFEERDLVLEANTFK